MSQKGITTTYTHKGKVHWYRHHGLAQVEEMSSLIKDEEIIVIDPHP